ncbi:MAG: STAS domain-containing protein [Planctomycetota bacterium]
MGTKSGDETISLRTQGTVVIATVHGGCFHEEKAILATLEKLGQVIDTRKHVQMVLDMSTISYLSSAGLGRLVALLKKSMAGGGCIHLANVQPEIRELFDVMRLNKIFKVFQSVDEAVKSFTQTTASETE